MSDILDGVSELEPLITFLDDDDIDNAIQNVVKLVSRINSGEAIPPASASRLVVLLSAYATMAGFKATQYKTVGKMQPNARTKYDMYKSASYHLDKLVDSIKYMAK